MAVREFSLIGALLLAGCGGAAPEPPVAETNDDSAAPPPAAAAVTGPQVNVLAFGDSLFAGYGLSSPDQSYPAQLQAALREDGHNVRVANAGVSGDTTAAGLQRLAFTLDSQPAKPDLVLLELVVVHQGAAQRPPFLGEDRAVDGREVNQERRDGELGLERQQCGVGAARKQRS